MSSTTGGWYNSPVNSPRLQHHQQYYGSNSSLANMNPALMQSDPNLNAAPGISGAGLGQYDRCMSGYNTPSGSYSNIHQLPIPEPSGLLEPLRRNERSASMGNLHLLAQNNQRLVHSSILIEMDEIKMAAFFFVCVCACWIFLGWKSFIYFFSWEKCQSCNKLLLGLSHMFVWVSAVCVCACGQG